MPAQQPLATFLEQSTVFHDACSTIYKPLDRDRSQTRLVHLQPGQEDDEAIYLKLEIISLDDPPPFQAISYTWGNLSPTKLVFLEDVPYNVTENQYEVLRRFRFSNKIRTMWMDVLCINESDAIERSWQVSMMSRIYSSSQQTQIWFGELNEECLQGLSDEQWSKFEAAYWQNSDQGVCSKDFASTTRSELLPYFSEALERPDPLVQGALRILRLFAESQHLYDMPMMYLDADGVAQLFRPWFESMRVLRSVLQKPWWTRVWTTQEALLSPTAPMVHFGKYEVSFSQFQCLGQSYTDHLGTTGACCQWWSSSLIYYEDLDQQVPLESDFFRCVIFYTYSRRMAENVSDRLWYALGLSNTLKTMDHRDYVYGVLGLVPTESRPPIDYTASTSEVFQLATQKIWAEDGNLNTLVKGSLEHDARTGGLPSWCIDWANSDTLSFRFYGTFNDDNYKLQDGLNHECSSNCLVLPAVTIDSIKTVLGRVCEPSAASSHSNRRIVESWASQLQANEPEWKTILDPGVNQDSFRRFFKTIFRDTAKTMNSQRDLSCQRLSDSDWDDIEAWWTITANADSSTGNDDYRTTTNSAQARRYCLDFFLGVSDSTLAITKDNELCMVPLTTKPGDMVVHIYDCCAPLVLRHVEQPPSEIIKFLKSKVHGNIGGSSSDASASAYRIVGPCYLKGHMGSKDVGDLIPESIALI